MGKETNIQNAICEYLERRRHFFWRQNTGAVLNHKTGVFRAMPKYSMNGIPDIIVIKDGYFVGLEVKQPKAKQQESQLEFEKKCKDAGGEYHVVRSIDDVKNIGL